MKRLLLRLSLLAIVIGLGTVAVFEAKHMLRYDEPAELPAIARREEEPRPIPLALERDQEFSAMPESCRPLRPDCRSRCAAVPPDHAI